MTDRTELLESALESLPDGVALIGADGLVVFWNRAAEAITGHAGVDLLARPLPEALEPLLLDADRTGTSEPATKHSSERGTLVLLQHKLGHEAAAVARMLVLRDGMGKRIGTAAVFRPGESLDALPHGEWEEGSTVEASHAEVEDRLEAAFDDFSHGGQSFGVLWITVDQAHELRKTHGAGGCEAMLERVERTLAHGLRPNEEMGRWGDDEFLVLSHERTPAKLADHAQTLAGLARTSDFRWWGDRVSLTVSIGAAQAELPETLAQLLGRAQAAMLVSLDAGGNYITAAPGRHACSPS